MKRKSLSFNYLVKVLAVFTGRKDFGKQHLLGFELWDSKITEPKTARDPCPHHCPPHPVRTPQPEDSGRGRQGWGRNPRMLEGCSLLWAPKTSTEPSPRAERSRHVIPTRSDSLTRSDPLTSSSRVELCPHADVM